MKLLRGIKDTTDALTGIVNSAIQQISQALHLNLSAEMNWLIANLVIWGSLFLIVKKFIVGRFRTIILVIIIFLALSYILQAINIDLLSYFMKLGGG